jgi:hypothetical protein
MVDIITKYCTQHAIMPTNGSGSVPPMNMTTGTALQDVWFNLDLPWAQMNVLAKASPFMILWDKAMWKQWL